MVSRSEKRAALVSTTRFVIDPVHRAASAGCPDLEFIHIVDEGILLTKGIVGEINAGIISWLKGLLSNAVAAGASRAVVTCSSLSPAVKPAAEGLPIPVARIDYPLYREVLRAARNPAVVMTLPSTREPSQLLIDEVRRENPGAAQPEIVLLENAFRRLNSGDTGGHDREVIGAIERLAADHDAILLAQISISRVLEQLSPELRKITKSSLDFLPGLLNGDYD
jgi:Asp/Glu/Hydantoin racemase